MSRAVRAAVLLAAVSAGFRLGRSAAEALTGYWRATDGIGCPPGLEQVDDD